MDSIANPQLNDDPGAIIAFPDEASGLSNRNSSNNSGLPSVFMKYSG
jgi:hypothetical protein